MKKIILLFLIPNFLFLHCTEWELDRVPEFHIETSLVDLNPSGGVALIFSSIQGEFDNATVSEYGLCWSDENPLPQPGGNENCVQYGVLNRDTTFTTVLDGLKKEQTYHVRAYIQVNENLVFGSSLDFSTGVEWKKVGDFPYSDRERWQCVSFILDGRFYLGLGATSCFDEAGDEFFGASYSYCGSSTQQFPILYNDFWRFDPEQGTWEEGALPDLPGSGRRKSIAFTIDDHVYVGYGQNAQGTAIYSSVYKLGPSTNQQWEAISLCPQLANRTSMVAFSLNGKGYVGLGWFGDNWNNCPTSLFSFDPESEVWDAIAPFPGLGRGNATAFVLNGKAYVGTGYNNQDPEELGWLRDFYEYDPQTDSWREIASLPGFRREGSVSFSIGEFGYVVTGSRGFPLTDYWRYNPKADKWFQIGYDPSMAVRTFATGFSEGNRGYVLMGKINYRSMGGSCWMYFPQ